MNVSMEPLLENEDEESPYPSPSEVNVLPSMRPSYGASSAADVRLNVEGTAGTNQNGGATDSTLTPVLAPLVPNLFEIERGAVLRPTMFVVDFGKKSVQDVSLQKAFSGYKKEKQKEMRSKKRFEEVPEETRLALMSNPDNMWKLRMRFLKQARKYFGIPYAKKYWTSEDPEYQSPIFLDCCGLVRRVMRDLRKRFGFRLGPWNQAYMHDTLPITVQSEENMKPGDLVFISAIYHNPKSKKQKHNMTHVEIWLGEGVKTIGARWQKGKVQVFDSYQFNATSYHSPVYIFKSIDTWLMGICKSHCPEHAWLPKSSEFTPTQHSIFASADQPSGQTEEQRRQQQQQQQQQQQADQQLLLQAAEDQRDSRAEGGSVLGLPEDSIMTQAVDGDSASDVPMDSCDLDFFNAKRNGDASVSGVNCSGDTDRDFLHNIDIESSAGYLYINLMSGVVDTNMAEVSGDTTMTGVSGVADTNTAAVSGVAETNMAGVSGVPDTNTAGISGIADEMEVGIEAMPSMTAVPFGAADEANAIMLSTIANDLSIADISDAQAFTTEAVNKSEDAEDISVEVSTDVKAECRTEDDVSGAINCTEARVILECRSVQAGTDLTKSGDSNTAVIFRVPDCKVNFTNVRVVDDVSLSKHNNAVNEEASSISNAADTTEICSDVVSECAVELFERTLAADTPNVLHYLDDTESLTDAADNLLDAVENTITTELIASEISVDTGVAGVETVVLCRNITETMADASNTTIDKEWLPFIQKPNSDCDCDLDEIGIKLEEDKRTRINF